MILEITFFKQIKMLRHLIVCFFLSLFILYPIVDFNNITELCLAFGPFVLLFMVPTLYLHYNYYINGKNLIFDFNEDKILLKDRKIENKFKILEIEEVVFFMTAVKMNDNFIRNFTFEDYYYGKLILKNREEVIISCLFSSKINEIIPQLKDVKITKQKMFFPIIK